MTKPEIVHDDFAKIDMRVGEIVETRPFPRARNPSWKLLIRFGDLGDRWSSAQVTNYDAAELVGRQVVCVVNFPPRNIAGFLSEVLVLGAANEAGEIILLKPSADVPLGAEIS